MTTSEAGEQEAVAQIAAPQSGNTKVLGKKGAGRDVDDEGADTDSATLLDEQSKSADPFPPIETPPLPNGAPPGLEPQDDGWDPVWDPTAQAYYFYSRFTGASQWTNPRVPVVQQPSAPGVGNYDRIPAAPGTTASAPGTDPQPQNQAQERPYGGYDPAIHGDYDPNASYAQPAVSDAPLPPNAEDAYAATGAFNRFTGKWQAADVTPELHNDENKSKRQMNAFFDVDAAANSHNGKSLKAERSGKKLSKQELKAFKEKRKEKKEERRRAWLRD